MFGFRVGGMSSTIIGFLVLAAGLGVCLQLRRSWMEANGRTVKTGAARLGRIKKASWFIVVLMSVCLVMGFYEFLAFLVGWPSTLENPMRAVIGHEHIFQTATEMRSVGVLELWVVQKLLAFWGGIMLLRLFWLYRRAILFSAKNVTCIRFFGWWLMIDWYIEFQMSHVFHDSLSMTPFFCGLLVIFVAWIMDEGRKIQEEQELTV